ncbi:MFS transporter [Streptomyces sp. NPDC060131]|uniref:MFS transporter n=1 Tax=unclassified Streptomyces TaxID=2593676 RepID=UPI0036562B9E
MTSQISDTPPRRAGARQWIGLAFLLLPTMLLTADLGVLWLATPPLSADLEPTSTELLWINDIYGFVIAGLLVLTGNLGDRFGRRRVLLIGAAAFTVASVVAAYAPNPLVLIGGRALLGVAGAAIMPATLALISHMFTSERQRARAIAMWVTALSAGIAVGPVISGVMLEHFWWGSVFLLGVPVMAAALIVTPLTVPEHANRDAKKLDFISMPLLLLTLLPLVLAIKNFGEHGLALWTVLPLVAGAVFGAVFVARQRRIDNPLLELSLFGQRTFTAALLLLFVGLAAMNGVEYVVPQYLQLVSGVPSAETGWLMVLPAVGLVIGSQATPLLTRRVRPAYVIAGGALIAVIGFVVLTTLPSDGSGVAIAAVGTTVMMAGLAPITVLGTGIAVGAAPPAKAGQAAAVGQTSYELGLAFGIAATGSVMAAVYRGHVSDSAPAGVSKDVVAEAANNYSGGVAVAERVPGELGPALADVVRSGLTSGLHTAAVVSACLSVLLCGLSVWLLRNVPVTGAEESADDEHHDDKGHDDKRHDGERHDDDVLAEQHVRTTSSSTGV